MRVKNLRITPEVVMEIIKKGFHPAYMCIENALPEDAKVIELAVAPPYHPNQIWAKIESKEFEDVGPTESIPFLKSPVFKRLGATNFDEVFEIMRLYVEAVQKIGK